MAIYDCFTFFNELELLELRLNVLNDIVDHFVLVEADMTFSNHKREFLFEEKFNWFKDHLNKIIYVKVEDMPDSTNPWDLEYYQRNCIMRGLKKAQPEDLVLISDIDEIPDPEAIKALFRGRGTIVNLLPFRNPIKIVKRILDFSSSLCRPYHGIEILEKTPVCFKQRLFYYFLNCQSPLSWNGTVILKAKNLESPQKLRDQLKVLPRLLNGGWHFSYLGGVEKIMDKINSYSHTELNTPQINTKNFIEKKIENGEGIFGQTKLKCQNKFVKIDSGFPCYIKALIEKYPYLYHETAGSTDRII